MKYYGRLSVAALLAIAPLYGFAQEKVVPIKYGDMDQWIIRKVHESGVIGTTFSWAKPYSGAIAKRAATDNLP
jgi:hypothetical protein